MKPTTRRQAQVSKIDEQTLGVCIFLSANQLKALGIDVACTDTIEYQIRIESGQKELEITEPRTADSSITD